MSFRVSLAAVPPNRARARLRLAINGRFLGQPISGVQRYGREAIVALDRLLAATGWLTPDEVTIFVPRSVPMDAWPEGLRVFAVRPVGQLDGHAWEQLELPRFAAGTVLINLTNSAPLAHTRQIVAVHDAAIRAYPGDFRWRYRAWYRLLYRLLNRRRSRFITVSDFAADEIARHFGFRRDAISVVQDAAEHMLSIEPAAEGLAALGLGPRQYVLVVGGRSRRKNLDLAVRGLELLPAPRPELVVVGGGSGHAFSRGTRPALEGCRSVGQVSDAVLKALYRNALCLVFPSRYEGFGLPPLEAMACGCPVVASRAASLPEVCGDAALYCDPDDPGTVTRAILALMSDAGLRDRLVAQGLARARSFSWERSARRLFAAASPMLGPGLQPATVLS